MKYFWKPLLSYTGKVETRFPTLITALAAAATSVLALVLSAATLEGEQLSLSLIIWRLLALPVAVCAATASLCSVIFYCFSSGCLLKQLSYAEIERIWKMQASSHLQLAEHASLFPVENAALKILKLEGAMPADADIPRRLAVEDDEASGMNRTQIVMKQLMEQLDLARIDARIDRPEICLYVRNATELVRREVESVIRASHAAFERASIHFPEEMPELFYLQSWAETPFAGFRLLIVAELHEGEDREFCEYACALMFSQNRQIADNRMPVCCFKGMKAKVHQLGKKLNVLLSAEQITPANLRYVWTGDLQGESLHLLMDSLNENKADINVRGWQSMRISDTWTTGYQWLMMEWSATAVRNGQRGQLIAAKEKAGEHIMFLQMNSEVSELKDNYDSVHSSVMRKASGLLFCGFLFSASLVFFYASYIQGWMLETDFLFYVLIFIEAFLLVFLCIVIMKKNISKLDAELEDYYNYE